MKNQKGITLIALVITIIVLLILAGITIAMLTGENGLLTKASGSASESSVAGITEKLMVEFQNELADYLQTKHTTASTASQTITTTTLVEGIGGTISEGVATVDGCKLTVATGSIQIDHPATGTAKATKTLTLTYDSQKDAYTFK